MKTVEVTFGAIYTPKPKQKGSIPIPMPVPVPAPQHRKYSYKTSLDLEVGDIVLVDSPSNGIVAVTVRSVNDTLSPNKEATKWIIQKVDFSEWEENVKREERKQEIKAKIEAKKEELEELAIYEMLAKSSPEIAGLLEELKGL